MKTPTRKLFSVSVKRKCGYIDEKGHVVITPRFSWSDEFSEGYAVVGDPDPAGGIDKSTGQVQQLFGYIDVDGNPITPVKFNQARRFSEGLAGVFVGKKFGYIKTSGEYLVEPQFDSGTEFSEELAAVKIGKRCRVIDTRGKTVFETTVSTIGECREGLMHCEAQHKWSFLDHSGKTVFKLTCSAAGDFSEGVASVLVKGKIGYINKQGKTVIEPKFGQAGDFMDSLTRVEFLPGGKHDFNQRQNFGYINKEGERAFSGSFVFANDFSEGLAAVNRKSDSVASYIDRSGEIVIDNIRCETAAEFKDGLAAITLSSCKWGYIDRSGDYVWEPRIKDCDLQYATPHSDCVTISVIAMRGTIRSMSSLVETRQGCLSIHGYAFGNFEEKIARDDSRRLNTVQSHAVLAEGLAEAADCYQP